MSDIRYGINPTQVDSAAAFPLGLIVDDPRRGFEGNKIKYVKFGGTVTQGQAVQLDVTAALAERHANVIATSVANQKIEGISLPSTVASGQFGWITYQGRHEQAACAATIVAGALLVPTGTAGTLDDVAFSGPPTDAELQGVFGGRQVRALSTTSGGFATVLVQ